MKLFSLAQVMLLIIFSLALICLSFFSVINSNFKSVPAMLSFLQKANVYENLSDVARLEIQAYYPPIIANNMLVTGVVNRGVEFIITPQLVEKIAGPALFASVEFAKAPTAIIDKKVVIATALYKEQAKELLSDFGIPGLLRVNLNYVVDSLPSQLTLVNLEKNPNNILGIIVKARVLFEQNRTLLTISWVVIILSAFFLVILNLHRLKKIVKDAVIVFGVSGFFIVLISLIAPWIISQNLPSAQTALEISKNKLITDALQVLIHEIRIIGIVYVVIAVLSFALFKFIKYEKVQKLIDKKLKRVHVPQVTVEVN